MRQRKQREEKTNKQELLDIRRTVKSFKRQIEKMKLEERKTYERTEECGRVKEVRTVGLVICVDPPDVHTRGGVFL